MKAERDVWAEVADRFVDQHYRSIRGQVRTYVISQHLSSYLPPPPTAVVDVGGGAGTQSTPLARLGYQVTIVDSSPAMLERAQGALGEEDPEIAQRVRLVEARGEDAPHILDPERFQVVLCHGVLPYVAEPAPLIDSLVALTAAGGLISIVAKNRETLAVRPALEGRWKEALAAFDDSYETNRLGLETRADTVAGLSALLEQRGIEPQAWFGVRLFTDGWRDEDPGANDLEDLLAVELEASRRDPYRRLSRLFHLIGRRSESRGS